MVIPTPSQGSDWPARLAIAVRVLPTLPSLTVQHLQCRIDGVSIPAELGRRANVKQMLGS